MQPLNFPKSLIRSTKKPLWHLVQISPFLITERLFIVSEQTGKFEHPKNFFPLDLLFLISIDPVLQFGQTIELFLI